MSTPSTPKPKRKILVIEDDPALRHTMTLVLRAKGHEPLDADDGIIGVRLAREQRPDLIISDINMPGCDGWEVLDQLRNNPDTSATPFILMTGESDDESLRRGMESGADDYLPKPFTMETLLATVEARLRKMDAVRQQAESKLTELRSNLSLMLPHELNTPLVGILGFGEILTTCSDTLPPRELVEIGQGIIESGQRLQRLVQNFLLYSQLELLGAQVRDLHLAQGSSGARGDQTAADTALKRASHYKREDDLKLQIGEINPAMASELFGKLVEEIVDNSFKFSPRGSPVTVLAGTTPAGVSFVVTDQGRGFKPEHIAQVNAYAQFDRKTHEQQGSGLGLTIAKRITELHGGSLRIVSNGTSGTTIEVRLPTVRG